MWYVGHPSFSAVLKGYLGKFKGPVRDWRGHTWLHSGGIRIADGGERGESGIEPIDVNGYSIKPQREVLCFESCWTRIILDYSYTCHFNVKFEF